MEIEIITRSLKSGGQQKQYITRSLLMYLKCSTAVLDSPSNSETLKLSSDACRMASWDEVLQGIHLSPPIPHLSLTQIHRAECTCRYTRH